MPKTIYLYSIYDRVAEEFGPIFEAGNEAIALRAKKGLLKQVDPSMLADFDLFCVGEYEIVEGGVKVQGYDEMKAVIEVVNNA